MNNRKIRAEGAATAVVVLIVMVIAIGVSYDVGAGSAKTLTKTQSTTLSEITTIQQTQTVTELRNAPKTNLTAAFVLYGTNPSIQYQFYNLNNTLLGSGTADTNATVLVFSQTVGKVTLMTRMPQCLCSAKISLSDNGSLIAVGYNTAQNTNNLTGFA